MKRFIILFLSGLMCLASCQYDDSELRESIRDHEDRLNKLEQLCSQLNTNINGLQTIVNALQENDYITSITPIKQGNDEIGYNIEFSKSGAISIYHGTDGKDGHSPKIGVKADADGLWYWTLEDEWLLDANGKKIRAEAEDGTDGITPELKIEESYWFISYDKGKEWKKLGKAVGADGDTMFSEVTIDDGEVKFTMSDGQTFTVPRNIRLSINFDIKNDEVEADPGKTIVISYTVQNADENTVVTVSSDGYYKVKIERKDSEHGSLSIQCPNPFVDGYVNVILSDGKGFSLIKVIRFFQGRIEFEEGQEYKVSPHGGSLTIPCTVNFDYTVKQTPGTESWLKIMPKTRAQMHRDDLNVEISANTELAARSATISFSPAAGEDSTYAEIKISQNGATFELSETKVSVPYTQCNKKIQIRSSLDISYVVPEDVDWIKADLIRQEGDIYTLNLDILENTGTLPRTALIDILNSQDNRKLGAISVEQESMEPVDPNDLIFVVQASMNKYMVVKLPIDLNWWGETYLVDWGDGNVEEFSHTDYPSHTYDNSKPGKRYTVKVSGKVRYIDQSCGNDTVTDIIQWGNTGLEKIDLHDCEALQTISDKGCENWENITDFSFNIDENYKYGAFTDCSSLTSIPENLFVHCPNVTDFSCIFSGCHSLTSIPENLFANCTDVTSFDSIFSYCTSLTSLPPNLFANCKSVQSFDYTFCGCRSLTSLPEGLFANCSNVHSFYETFYDCRSLTCLPDNMFNCPKVGCLESTFSDCRSLTSLPGNLFEHCPNVMDFHGTFSGCSSLMSLPEGFFANCSSANNFHGTFSGCSSLASIPSNLFANCPEVLYFENTFSGCSSLTSIPEILFENCPNVLFFNYTFRGCSSLTSIPWNLFANCKEVSSFSNTFIDCSSLTSVPENLFANCPRAGDFHGTFSGCSSLASIPENLFAHCPRAYYFKETFSGCSSLTSIPVNLFANCPEVLYFEYAFQGCSSLTSIPENLFANCTDVTGFERTFFGCSSLTSLPAGLFRNNRKVRTFEETFRDCRSLTGESPYDIIEGKKVHLYERSFFPDYYVMPIYFHNCFAKCSKLSDWYDIPYSWREYK